MSAHRLAPCTKAALAICSQSIQADIALGRTQGGQTRFAPGVTNEQGGTCVLEEVLQFRVCVGSIERMKHKAGADHTEKQPQCLRRFLDLHGNTVTASQPALQQVIRHLCRVTLRIPVGKDSPIQRGQQYLVGIRKAPPVSIVKIKVGLGVHGVRATGLPSRDGEASHGNKSKHRTKQKNGAGERNRTPDRLITNQLLYQLSYASFGPGSKVIEHLLSEPAIVGKAVTGCNSLALRDQAVSSRIRAVYPANRTDTTSNHAGRATIANIMAPPISGTTIEGSTGLPNSVMLT